MAYELNEYLKEERKRQGLTQQQIADKLTCNTQLISSWENNHRRIPRSRYEELADAFEIPLNSIIELAAKDNTMYNEFNKMFSELQTPSDAMKFISYTLKDFETDSAEKVSLGAFLRNYLLMQLIVTMLEKDTYAQNEGDDFIWDYTWFSANVEFAANNKLFESKHSNMYEKIVEFDNPNDLETAGGRVYEILTSFIQGLDENHERVFRIHLLEYVHHLDDLAEGINNPLNQYYCSHFISE